jgi:hypothetical protein
MGLIAKMFKLQTGDDLVFDDTHQHHREIGRSTQKVLQRITVCALAIEQIGFCGPANAARLTAVYAINQRDECIRIGD